MTTADGRPAPPAASTDRMLPRVAAAATWTALAVGVVALVESLAPAFAAGADVHPFPPLVAVALIAAAAALIARTSGRPHAELLMRGAGVGTVVLGAVALAASALAALGMDALGIWRAYGSGGANFSAIGVAATAVAALGIALLRSAGDDARAWPTARIAAAVTLALGLVAVVGLLARSVAVVPDADAPATPLGASLAVVLLAMGLLAGRPDPWLVHVATGRGAGAALLRQLLPVGTALPVVLACLAVLGDWSGLLDQPLGLGLSTLVLSVAFGAAIVWAAAALDRMEARREWAEEEAQAQRGWLQVTLAAIGEAVVTTDERTAVRLMNPAAERLTGWRGQEAVGRPLARLLDLRDDATDDPLACPVRTALAAGGPVGAGGESVVVARDGSRRPIEVNAAPIYDAAGRACGAVLVLREVAARREAERAMRAAYAELDRRVTERTLELDQTTAALRERTALLSAITASTPDLIFAKDRESRILWANPATLAVLGRGDEPLPGDQGIGALPPDERALILEHDRHVLETGETLVAEEPLTRDGATRTYLVTKSPLKDEAGGVLGLIGVATDITERKCAERELRTLVASEQRLRSAAEQASRAKDDFLAIVSHELRSPLNALRGWSHLLESASPPNPDLVARAVRAIKRSVDNQTRLIDDLLDTTRILSGRLSIERRPVNVVAVLHSSLETARPAAAAKSIELRFRSLPGVPAVEGDAERLQQVVGNLLANAIKFTPEHGLVEATVQPGDGACRIVVRDTGIGIAPEFLPHVFERFRQADESITRRAGGLGIGLALVRHIVEAHGGRVRAESAGPGRGATFVVDLPAAAARSSVAANDERRRDGAEGESALGSRPLAGVSIYMVDDDHDARDVVAAALRQAGAKVEAWGTGRELHAALQRALPERAPDLLLFDLAMPGEDGFSLLRRVRAMEAERRRSRAIPALAVSAFAPIERERLAEAGFRDCVGKPVEPERLFRAILAAVPRDAQTPAGVAAEAPVR